MSDYFSAREAEFQADVVKHEAERRKRAEKEGAKLKAEADKALAEVLDAFPAPPETPEPAPRPTLDRIREHYNLTPGERERIRAQEWQERRAAINEADLRAQTRGQEEKDELGVNGLVNPPALDWDEIDNHPDEYYDQD